ncbi:hypothetical protein C0995_001871 [Termitomyces sp. Mi166|nr:hypothetical protein C0995_001871 [Termitomyces sp. Mi166\
MHVDELLITSNKEDDNYDSEKENIEKDGKNTEKEVAEALKALSSKDFEENAVLIVGDDEHKGSGISNHSAKVAGSIKHHVYDEKVLEGQDQRPKEARYI